MAQDTKFIKDPSAVLDYTIDWSLWLSNGETITTSVWTVPTGITGSTQSISGSKTITWLSGGTAGNAYTISNRITTSAGRTDDRSFLVVVENR
jgi:hypothetical protein